MSRAKADRDLNTKITWDNRSEVNDIEKGWSYHTLNIGDMDLMLRVIMVTVFTKSILPQVLKA